MAHSETVQQAREAIVEALGDLHADWFVPEMRLTFIARMPGNTACEIIVTADDDLDAIMDVIKRSKKRVEQ